MMMTGSSSRNGYGVAEDRAVAEGEGGCSTPKDGATTIVEEGSCNKKLSEDVPEGVEANENTDSSNTTWREMITRRVEMSRQR
jgi:hypothetical protein